MGTPASIVMAGAGPPSTPVFVQAKAWMPTSVGMTRRRCPRVNVIAGWYYFPRKVRHLHGIRGHEQRSDDLAINQTARVLDRAYRPGARDIPAAIERVLQANALLVENEQQVFTSMIALKQGRGSFADALIGAPGTAAGCSCAVTFGRKALRLGEFEPV